MVLSFLIFKAMRILVLKFSKIRKPKSFSLNDFNDVVAGINMPVVMTSTPISDLSGIAKKMLMNSYLSLSI